jgi:hypothetical protein
MQALSGELFHRDGSRKYLTLEERAAFLEGSVAKLDFWGKIQKSGIRNSTTYRLLNSRKSNFATEPPSMPKQSADRSP